jgi:Cu(I)/Ag(I) efflux system membrane fusion protein
MFVDYTGVPVKKGDHMVEIYSPELISAQEEYLLALRSAKKSEGRRAAMNKRLLEATREKLLLWGLTEKQLKTIEKRGKPSDHTTIYAPVGGIVIQKNALEGSYVETGTKIYAIVDLNHLWVRLDAYESDLMWVRYGQEVEFSTQAYPGEVFKGRISFIDPVLNDQTRTVKVRANVENPAGRLKPQMFVKASVKAKVAKGGKVMDADLAGKWIGPMHPEIVRDEPGDCPICGMPLVKVETYGFVPADVGKEAPLVIPASAPLLTGTRAIVYVEVADTEEPTYEGREIVLGPRAGDYYLVKSGLSEGERVVTKGNFKIDSALQILAKPSMMNPEGGGPAPGHVHQGSATKAPETTYVGSTHKDHEEPSIKQKKTLEDIPVMFRQQLSDVALAYMKLSDVLVQGKASSAKTAATAIKQALDKVDMSLIKGSAHVEWMKDFKELKGIVNKIEQTDDIQRQRKSFALLSESLGSTLKRFGHNLDRPVRIFNCPMAFDGRGGAWLQISEDVQNPYFGAAMLKCGSQTAVIESGN